MALVAKGNKLTMRAVLDTIFFVLEKICNERRQNFLKYAIFVAKYDVRLILGYDFDELLIYEFRRKNETVSMKIWGFSLPFFRMKGRGLNFDNFDCFCQGTPSQYKIIIEPARNRVEYIVQWYNYVEDAFMLDEEKAIKKVYSDP